MLPAERFRSLGKHRIRCRDRHRSPGLAVAGLMLAMRSEFTVNVTPLLITPPCKTWALPELDPVATVATICVSFQLCTTPLAVPNHTCPVS